MSSKLKEALEFIKLASDDWETYANTIGGALDVIYEKACAALTEPPRNCDVGDAEEQFARFKKWCEGEFYKRPMNALTGEPCKSCPCYSVAANGVNGCNYLRWANMPYEKKGGEE